jgi:DNA-binding MarR family transcriptional regulator
VNKPPSQDEEGRTLQLLELIHRDGMLTQRELARKLNIALGLVNLSLKRLMHQELIKVRRLSARRFCYLLTPGGMHEKARLSARYLTDSFAMYRSARRAFLNRLAALRDAGRKRVVLYGTTEIAEAAFITLEELGFELVAVAGGGGPDAATVTATDSATFLGRRVAPLAEVDPRRVDAVLFAGPEEVRGRCREEAAAAGFDPGAFEDLTVLLLEGEGREAGTGPAKPQRQTRGI